MKEALFYIKQPDNRVICHLCPHNCNILADHRGICGVKLNKKGILFSEVYGIPVALYTDPVEKKPLYHYYPGHQILSLGTIGCNMKCSFCQNCEISQVSGEDQPGGYKRSIEEILSLALQKQKNIGLAYTYNEPVIFYEYMVDLAAEIHKHGLKNVMVSNGYINREPLLKLLGLIDAFNIDLKSFEDEFYRKYTKSSLKPVLDTIKAIFRNGNHIELTFLVIPGLNDSIETFKKMLDWIIAETGRKTVLHISRYFPRYKMSISPTPIELLELLYHQAREKLDFVYLGNIPDSDSQSTFCPSCKSLLLKRKGYYTVNEGLDTQGNCLNCNEKTINFMRLS